MDTLKGFADLGQVINKRVPDQDNNDQNGKGVRFDENQEANITTLAHLVDTDLTAAIRLILDRGWSNTYEELLLEHEARQKAAIEELCGQHYQDFVSSVESLVDVKHKIAQLKSHIR